MIRIFSGNTSPSIVDTIKVNGVVFDLTGSAVTFNMRPADTATPVISAAAAITSTADGAVRYDWIPGDTDVAGEYAAWWSVELGSGATQDTSEFAVEVARHAEDSGSLANLVDVRRELELPDSDTSRDDLIETYIQIASEAIQNEYEREFAPQVTATRRFTFTNSRLIDLAPYDLQTITSITIDPEGITAPTVLNATTDYSLQPAYTTWGVGTYLRLSAYLVTGFSDFRLRYGYSEIDIAGLWGWPTIPATVRQACTLTVASWLRRDYGNFDIAGLTGGREIAPDQPMNFSIPPAARRLLAPYARRRHF